MNRPCHRERRSWRDEAGFSLIELLVVVLIVGVLAAIAIPAFLGQREKSHDTSAKSAVRQAHTAAESYATSNNAEYTGMDTDALKAIESTLGEARNFAVDTVSASGYRVTVSSASAGRTFSITRTSSGVRRSCTPAGGGCRTTATGVDGW